MKNVSQECQYWKQKADNNQTSDSTIVSCSSSLNEHDEKTSTSSTYKINGRMKEIKDENAKLKTVLEGL